MSADTYKIDRIREAAAHGKTTIRLSFGAGSLTWHPKPDRWCRYCGVEGRVWESIGEDYYHGETTICLECGRSDCCWQAST